MAKALIKTNAMTNKECECKCGNKHEYYGGKGHTTIACIGSIETKTYIHHVKCNACGAISKFEDRR